MNRGQKTSGHPKDPLPPKDSTSALKQHHQLGTKCSNTKHGDGREGLTFINLRHSEFSGPPSLPVCKGLLQSARTDTWHLGSGRRKSSPEFDLQDSAVTEQRTEESRVMSLRSVALGHREVR